MENGAAVALEPFDGDPDPSPIGSAMLGARLVAGPHPAAGRAQIVSRARPRAGGDGRGGEPFVEVDWDTADRACRRRTRPRPQRARQQRDLRRLLRLGQRRPLPSRRKARCTASSTASAAIRAACRTTRFAAADVILPHVFGTTQGLATGHTPWSLIAGHSQADRDVRRHAAAQRAGQLRRHRPARRRRRHSRRARRPARGFVNISPLRDDALGRASTREWLAHPAQHRHRADARPRPRAARPRACTTRPSSTATRSASTSSPPTSAATATARRSRRSGPPRSPASMPATIRALAREMAAKRTLITVAWALQRADHGEQPYLDGGGARRDARPDRPARRRRRLRLCRVRRHRHLAVDRRVAVAAAGQDPRRRLHSRSRA